MKMYKAIVSDGIYSKHVECVECSCGSRICFPHGIDKIQCPVCSAVWETVN
jgi:ribosomal protein S27E